MENRSHALAAGLFTVAFVAALVFAAWWLAGGGEGLRARYVIVSESAVSGLTEQAPVRFLGVEVGRVDEIRFDPRQPRTILVTIAVDQGAYVTDRTFAQLGYQGVTGLSYVQLVEDGPPGQRLPTSRRHPARIPMRPSLLQEVGESGQELVLSARDAADRLAQLLSPENAAQISATLRHIESATAGFSETQRTIAPALRQLPALSRQFEQVLERSEVLVGNLNALTVEAQKRAEALESVGRTAREIGAIAGEVHDVTLPRTNRLLDRLTRSSESLEDVLSTQRDRPFSLLYGSAPRAPGPGEPGYAETAEREDVPRQRR